MAAGHRSSNRHGSAMSRRRFLGGTLAAVGGSMSGAIFPTPGAVDARAAGTQDIGRLRPTGATDEAYWDTVRREFNIVDDMVYMNNGTLGPMPRSVLDANIRYMRDIAADPRSARMDPTVRDRVAAFVGADADEIVLTRSTTEGMKIFCRGLDLNEGDEVLMSSHEHPGGYGAWRAREQRDGITVRTVDIPAPPESVDQVVSLCEQAITPKTRVLVVSYPIFVTGLLMPIKELAEMVHRHGVLLSVDGAHALGMLDLDFHASGVDHFSTAGQKWLMAGTGTGVAYFKRDIQDQIWGDMWRPNLDPNMGARKYEISGQRHIPSARGMGDAVDFQNAIGKANIQARVHQLAERLKNGLVEIPGVKLGTSMAREMSGGLTTFYIEGVPKATTHEVAMEQAGTYIVGSGLNDFACRVSTHLYNTLDQVDRLLATIRHIAENRSRYSASSA